MDLIKALFAFNEIRGPKKPPFYSLCAALVFGIIPLVYYFQDWMLPQHWRYQTQEIRFSTHPEIMYMVSAAFLFCSVCFLVSAIIALIKNMRASNA